MDFIVAAAAAAREEGFRVRVGGGALDVETEAEVEGGGLAEEAELGMVDLDASSDSLSFFLFFGAITGIRRQ